mmetsp:Transcript_6665/g.21049  ORF Transcript_6665/g.21049 Transcript_6665/m.21049 type:complete len:258 (-) Transcript_6665:108-881(-)
MHHGRKMASGDGALAKGFVTSHEPLQLRTLPPTGAPLSLAHDVPFTEEMHGALRRCGQSEALTASRQKAATSAREMEPAWPSITLMMPLGGSRVRPPGRTSVNSREAPGASAPPLKSASCAFLSANMDFITVIISTLNMNGACPSESPAPMDVTTATRFSPRAFISEMMAAVPSRSMVGPTSDVRPPSATTTPLTPSSRAASKAAATSARLVTSPFTAVSFGLARRAPAAGPPEPAGTESLDGSRHNATTDSPRSSA